MVECMLLSHLCHLVVRTMLEMDIDSNFRTRDDYSLNTPISVLFSGCIVVGSLYQQVLKFTLQPS